MQRIVAALLFLLVIFQPAFSIQYENLIVDQIEVIGVTPEGCIIDPAIVLSHIKTREGDFFSQSVFDSDLKTLAGEFDRVEPTLEEVQKKLKITLKVWPKPLIRSITWEGNCGIDTEDLKKELGVSICTVFDRLAFNKAFHKLKAYYIKRGYFEAELNYEVVFDPATQEVDIAIFINEGRSGWISRIFFHGFCPEEEDAIAEMMVTKKYNAFLSWLNNEGLYNEEAIQYDQCQILDYLQNRGYADAVVKIEAYDSPRFYERIHLHITADRGERYTLGELTFEGNTLFSDEQIAACFCVREGDCFSPAQLRATVSNIERLYGQKGYIDAAINFEPYLELDQGCVYSVNFTIEEGEQFRVGMIKVFGNTTTQTQVILHETLLVPGEIFNIDKLKLTEMRLANIGYFENVNVYAVRPEEGRCLPDTYRDVHIDIEEKQTGRFSVFFGYSSSESLFGGVTISEKNFNSAGLRHLFSKYGPGLRGGGEFLDISAQIGQKSTDYTLSWTKPYFMDTRWSVGFDVGSSTNRYISDDYNIKALSFNLRAIYELNAYMRTGWHYRIKHTRVSINHNPFGNCELFRASRIQGLISGTGFSFLYNSTDNPECPTRGFKSVAEIEYVGLGGDHTFAAFGYLNSYYVPLWPKGVLKFRGDLRFLQPLGHTDFDHIPLDERLFLGSDNTVRGYRPYRLGPVFRENTHKDDKHCCHSNKHHRGKKSDEPKGGLSMQIYSIEYNHQFAKRVNGFLFVDAGSLTKKNWHLGYLYLSTGFGARVRVFDGFPPVTLGYGFPLNAKRKNQVKRFFINFGGSF
jgi:outer membrane protein insertion porin family